MILGIGTDVCEVERIAEAIQRRGRRFLDRLFTPAEQALAASRSEPALFFAGRFAAKEALLKALGTGVTDRVRWCDIQVLQHRSGQPVIDLSEGALRRFKRLVGKGHVGRTHISLSHDGGIACAFVVLESYCNCGCEERAATTIRQG